MHWKVKATIQNLTSLLPSRMSYQTYYFMQRYFGSLRNCNPVNGLSAGVGFVRRIQQQGVSIADKTFLEVVTGHRLNIPIAFWLSGAGRTVTVDPNPYLRPELVREDIDYLLAHSDEILGLFKNVTQDILHHRIEKVIEERPVDLAASLQMMSIDYLAPSDPVRVGLPSNSIDFHVSYTTLEHVSPEGLLELFQEGRRLLKQDGLFVHFIDMTDHFSHSDPSITSVNFLRFSETDWTRYAGNRYMYQNRLRLDDYEALLKSVGVKVIAMETTIDSTALEALRQGLPLNDRFRKKSPQINATSGAWIVAR
jgi:SAM-dependent methyltransferase